MQRLRRLVRGFVRLKSSFFLVILLIQLLLILMSVLFARLAVAQLRRHEDEKARDVSRFVSTVVDQETDRALIATLELTRNAGVVEAFAARDRAKLKGLCDPIWADLQPLGFRQFNFHLPPGPEGQPVTMFLRMQSAERFGDDVSNRPTVVRCNLQKEVVKGLEQGRAGYGFRACAPLTAGGRHVGSVEFGSDFGEAFLNRLNVNYAGGWGLYNLDRGVSSLNDQALLVAVGAGKDAHFKSVLPPDPVLQKVRAGEPHFELRSATETGELYLPVRNFQNDIVLIVKHVYPTDYYRELRAVLTTAGVICAVGLVMSSLIIVMLYRQITIPIRKLVVEAENIRQFHLSEPVKIDAGLSELRDLVEATRSMKIGLQSFQKYVPDQLVRQLIQTNQEARVSGVRQDLTVFFSDVADFTTISEKLTPRELAGQLSEYLNELTEVIHARRGTVDKYIGDAIMAFWNAPLNVPNHPREACAAALECQRKCDDLARRFVAAGRPPFLTRIGLHTGDIIVGNMGSSQRLNYTVIGDAVNLASRLEGLNKVYGTRIIISDDTYQKAAADFEVRLLDFVRVKGRTEAVTIYELVAEKGEVTASDLEFLRYFNEGVEAYKRRDWDKALRIFARSLERRPHDQAGQIFSDRCRTFQASPPSEDWTGEYAHDSK